MFLLWMWGEGGKTRAGLLSMLHSGPQITDQRGASSRLINLLISAQLSELGAQTVHKTELKIQNQWMVAMIVMRIFYNGADGIMMLLILRWTAVCPCKLIVLCNIGWSAYIHLSVTTMTCWSRSLKPRVEWARSVYITHDRLIVLNINEGI